MAISVTKSKKRAVKRTTAFFTALANPINIISFILVLIAAAFFFRLYDLQVVQGAEYREKVLSQYYKTQRSTESVRGNIFFTNKDGEKVLAAGQIPTYTLAVNPNRVQSAEKILESLPENLVSNESLAMKKMQKENDPYEEIAFGVDKKTALEIAEMDLPGIVLVEKRERHYPGDDLSAEILGFMSFQDDDLVGSYGLEKQYDAVLTRGDDQSTLGLLGSFLGARKNLSFDESADADSGQKLLAREGSLVTTIEPTVSDFVSRQLDAIDNDYRSQYSGAIIMDPETGDIITMGTSNALNLNDEKKHYRNHLIEDRLELGSIIKPLTIAVALEENVIDRDFSFNDTGSVKIGKYTVRNFDGQGRGPFTGLQKILTNSLNTGLANIALQIDKKIFRDYFNDLGLGVETGVDLPGEVYGFIDSLDTGRDIEIATASFGQGIAFSPLAAARALATLANGGYLVTPHIGSKIEYGNLIPSTVHRPNLGERVFSDKTTKILTDFLVNIVDDSETFSPYSDPNFAVAIKTGTAEIPNPAGGYYDDRYLHTMMGYFPAYADPGEKQFLVLLMTMQPQGARYSSTTLKKPFFNIVEFMKNYYELTPDRIPIDQLNL